MVTNKNIVFLQNEKKTFDDARVKMIDSFTTKIQKKIKQTMGNTRLFQNLKMNNYVFVHS